MYVIEREKGGERGGRETERERGLTDTHRERKRGGREKKREREEGERDTQRDGIICMFVCA